MHATAQEAEEETIQMLNVYANFCENFLAMPVIRGVKTNKEKFSGAVDTYTIECMMHDRKALQSGTSHYFGDGFAKAFEIQFTGKDNQLHHPHQTSWGLSTRLIGGIIMTHGDNNGLVLPPKIAPIQAMVIPIISKKVDVTPQATEVLDRLKSAGIRAKIDLSDKSMGWKAAEYEMKGVPLRIELGPRDLEQNQCCISRRDTCEKQFVPLDQLEATVAKLLEEVQQGLFDRAKRNLDENTKICHTLAEVQSFMTEQGGFANTMWCGDPTCEETMKNKAGVSSRCMPLAQEQVGETCVCCGKPATKNILWGVAY